jgi:hypothetical protein
MTRSRTASPWVRYEPSTDDPWDLRKVAHLHRRAGVSATRTELIRDRQAGPDACVERLFHPPRSSADEVDVIEGLRQTARASQNLDGSSDFTVRKD